MTAVKNRRSKSRERMNFIILSSFVSFVTIASLSAWFFIIINNDSDDNFKSTDKQVEAAINVKEENQADNSDESIQPIIQLDEAWGRANILQRARVKLDLGFETIFTNWLDRDRSKTERIGNNVVFTGPNIRVIAYQQPR
jgi:hypothetical protein